MVVLKQKAENTILCAFLPLLKIYDIFHHWSFRRTVDKWTYKIFIQITSFVEWTLKTYEAWNMVWTRQIKTGIQFFLWFVFIYHVKINFWYKKTPSCWNQDMPSFVYGQMLKNMHWCVHPFFLSTRAKTSWTVKSFHKLNRPFNFKVFFSFRTTFWPRCPVIQTGYTCSWVWIFRSQKKKPQSLLYFILFFPKFENGHNFWWTKMKTRIYRASFKQWSKFYRQKLVRKCKWNKCHNSLTIKVRLFEILRNYATSKHCGTIEEEDYVSVSHFGAL